MENNSPKNEIDNFFITEEERKKLINIENRRTSQVIETPDENSHQNEYSSHNIASNEYITDSENMQSEENESNSNMNNISLIKKEFICEFYQAIKDDNNAFLEDFIITDANIKCILYLFKVKF